MPEGPDPSDPRWTVVREWSEPRQQIRIVVDAELRAIVHFRGDGSMPGAKALIDLMDDIREELGRDKVLTGLVDMRELSGAPLRAQFLIGKWLFQNKRQLASIAVFGGRPFEMKIAKAVMKIGGMKNATFVNRVDEAVAWLGWPTELYR